MLTINGCFFDLLLSDRIIIPEGERANYIHILLRSHATIPILMFFSDSYLNKK